MAKKKTFDVTVLFKGVSAIYPAQAQRKVGKLIRYKQRKKQGIDYFVESINPFR